MTALSKAQEILDDADWFVETAELIGSKTLIDDARRLKWNIGRLVDLLNAARELDCQ